MDDATRRAEFEVMLLSRHAILSSPGSRGLGNRLDRSAYILLTRLDTEGPMSIPQLQDAFGLDASTLNRQTTAMLRAGIVDRIPDPDGGIARKFRITEEGKARLDADRDEMLTALRKIVRDWTEQEVDDLAATLRRFNESVERIDGRPWPRD
ncbi:MarR family winged helix-turn-helix transcriptional regulator [Micromonospora rubida]|uniref:MarR family winged helix-turn-helix transcriptional regulator n=1 Tax=Micromonospora rubida TaxID=2697657 RepID=UPI00137703AD|nr:MarR family transcriptional regulator [Micromonospora rubida]NBE80935.1 MarR family transcriptional regulator [Micromonospora rubida]